MKRPINKSTYLLVNLLRGILFLALIISIFLIFKKYVRVDFFYWLKPVYERPAIVMTIFLVSEIVFGIIPPEVFMIWALRWNDPNIYIGIVAFLTFLSYGSGVIGFFVGRYFNTTRLYQIIKKRYLGKYERRLNMYGVYLIIVAALTPLPFSAICMIVGAVRYPFNKFLVHALFRLIRFAAYSWFIWQANAV
ncbi:MAG: YqaA family protein [Bacteroidota bacterium]